MQEDCLPSKISLVAGVDVAYFDNFAVSAVAILDYDSCELVESKTAIVPLKMPYIPTLLSFREIPPVLAVIRKMNSKPDVFLADGQGLAHPYGCGFASHLGLAVKKPTIGVAKSRLVGEQKEIDGKEFLIYGGKVVSSVLTTKANAKPVFVSVGHLISLKTAVKIVEHFTRSDRIPKPLLAAHNLATKTRNEARGKLLSKACCEQKDG